MPSYEIALQLTITIKAENPQEAHETLTKWQPPHNARLDNLDIIGIKRLGYADRRLITHLPNAPRDQVANAMLRLNSVQVTILGLCAKPQHMHVLFDCIRRIDGTITPQRMAKDVTELKNDGWLVPVEHNVELDSFPNFHARERTQAQFTSLARGGAR